MSYFDQVYQGCCEALQGMVLLHATSQGRLWCGKTKHYGMVLLNKALQIRYDYGKKHLKECCALT